MVNKNRLMIILLGLGLVSLLLVPMPYSQAQTVQCGGDFRILQGTDDAEEKRNDGSMILDDTLDLDLAQHEVGVRFQGVTVPQGAIITKAFIQFTSEQDDEEDDSAGVDIFAENADNSQTFSNNPNDITSRAKTVSTENWFIPQWPEIGTNAGLAQRTPDLSSLVQEVVNRGLWLSGNAMSFIFITYNPGDRDTKAFESDGDNEALLHIECFIPDPNVCQDVLLNFDGLPHGARLGSPDGSDPRTIHWKLAPYGIQASGIAHDPDVPYGQGLDTLIVYDSHFSASSTGNPDSSSNVGEDYDLEHPFNPDADPSVEGTPIIPTKIDPLVTDQSIPVASPNDWREGGTATYQFDHGRILKKLTGVDDLNTRDSMVTVFRDRDCTDQIGNPIPINQNDDDRGTHVYDFEDIFDVRCIKEFHPSSGGITNFDLGCDDPPPPVCGERPPPDISGLGENQVLGTTCIEPAANCVGISTLTLDYDGAVPATITAKDNNNVLKTVTIEQLPGSITVTADDVPGRSTLPQNTLFTITTFDSSSPDILVADDNSDSIIRVDPANGKQTLVSDHRDFDDPENLLIDAQGRLLVAEGDFPNDKGSILEVISATTLSTFSSGGFFDDGPEDLVEDALGNIYVLDDGARKIIRVDSSGNNQFSFAELNFRPEGITIDDLGNIIVVGGSGNGAKVISITPGGSQALVSEKQLLVRPEGVAFDATSGLIYVADGNVGDRDSSSETRGQIVSVDPGASPSSNQLLISPTSNSPFVDPSDVEIFAGKLIISDDAAGGDGMGAIIELDPDGTWRIISSNPISDAVDGAQLFDSPEGLFVAQSISQEDITVPTSCSLDTGPVHDSLTVTAFCKLFDNGQEQCFTPDGGPYDSLPLEVQYGETTPSTAPPTNYLTQNSEYSGGSSNSEQRENYYTEEPPSDSSNNEQSESYYTEEPPLGETFCFDMTVDELIASDLFDSIIDNRDGHLDGTTIYGDEKNNLILDSDASNKIKGRGGEDCLIGFGGNDKLIGNSGDDQIFGGDGNDIVVGGSGDDTLDGGEGNDTLRGGKGEDQMTGGYEDDNLRGHRGDDNLDGNADNDKLNGGKGQDTCINDAADTTPPKRCEL